MNRQSSLIAAPRAVVRPAGKTWQGLSRSDAFHEDDDLRALRERATSYVEAGVCLNLSGTAGLGKTTLALRIAEDVGRPVTFMTGNHWLTANDFIGREVGQTERTIVDKYVQSVRRTEMQSRADWKDAILAVAMTRGYTLVYDEFTRAPPEANSTLLSVLEEGVLVSTDRANKRSHIEAHDDFRMILTSNPHDYVGVSHAPDALMDRVVTLSMPVPNGARLAGIVSTRSGLDTTTARKIVDLVADCATRAEGRAVSQMRSALLIGRIAAHHLRNGGLDDAGLSDIAADVLIGRGVVVTRDDILHHLANGDFRRGVAS